jgi:hypothetical protein
MFMIAFMEQVKAERLEMEKLRLDTIKRRRELLRTYLTVRCTRVP